MHHAIMEQTVWRIFTVRGKIVSQDPLPNEKG